MTTAVCVASGPSFSEAQAVAIGATHRAGRCHVVVVNDNWRRLPDADVLYAADGRWWARYAADVAAGFRGERWTRDQDAATKYGLCWIKSRGLPGLSRDPSVIHEGSNSGYQAIGLAYHFGARRILLAGYDMQHRPGDPPHWFGRHPAGFTNSDGVAQWAPRFNRLADDLAAEGIELINCTTETALTIPRGDLATELARC